MVDGVITRLGLADINAEDIERIEIVKGAAASSLYGSDAAASPDTYPRAGWAAFRRLPLDEKEFRRIAANVTPYMRWTGPRRPRP